MATNTGPIGVSNDPNRTNGLLAIFLFALVWPFMSWNLKVIQGNNRLDSVCHCPAYATLSFQ
tara:strand:- start:1671 stop:1856 length:186 start_codon:yes stop_codon:yes gene_type:complete